MRMKSTLISITVAAAMTATPAVAAKPVAKTHGHAASPGQLCKSMSHKKTMHGKGKSAFAACVIGVNRARAEIATGAAVKTSPRQLCKTLSHKKSATDSKTPYAACISGAAKAQHL